ncbi:MAG: FAD:protein FMN transferase [Candidatus Caldatribacteriaceae bacterium]
MQVLSDRASFSWLRKKWLWLLLFFTPCFFLYFSRGVVMERYTFFGLDTVIEVDIPHRYAFLKGEMEQTILHFDRLWNRFSPESIVWKINHSSSCEVDQDTLQVIQEAWRLSEATGGFFCPLVAPLLDLWGFSTEPRVPGEEELQKVVGEISRSRLIVGNHQISIQGEGRLDLGGIAKGYVVDALVSLLRSRGVSKALINAGGQVFGFGAPWKVGIFDPVTNTVMGYIIIDGASVSTSGDYFRFFEKDGVRYHHVLNPVTGYPGRDFRSVTVVAPRALLADVLSTAILAGGREALPVVEKNFEGVAILTIDAQGVLSFSESMKKIFVFLSSRGVKP